MTPIATAGLPANVEKFLKLITFTEGTDRQGTPYNELFGFKDFVGYEEHPNIKVPYGHTTSTAAGRYQILKKTADFLGMESFTPEAQDAAAIQLIHNRHAYDDVIAGNWEEAIKKCNKEWASLPGSPYGQPTHTLAQCLEFINAL